MRLFSGLALTAAAHAASLGRADPGGSKVNFLLDVGVAVAVGAARVAVGTVPLPVSEIESR